jgi:hypothetical protein
MEWLLLYIFLFGMLVYKEYKREKRFNNRKICQKKKNIDDYILCSMKDIYNEHEPDEITNHICSENIDLIYSGGGDTHPLPVCRICGKIFIKLFY